MSLSFQTGFDFLNTSLKWSGHVSRSSGLAKTILQGTMKGGRRQGRQKTMLEDNIREWTGMEFAKSQRAVENREQWRKLVVNMRYVKVKMKAKLRTLMVGFALFFLASNSLHCYYYYCCYYYSCFVGQAVICYNAWSSAVHPEQ